MYLFYGLCNELDRGEWIQRQQPIPHDSYAELMDEFTAEAFDGRDYARLANEVGMNYAVLTASHHDGFRLYDSRGLSDPENIFSSYNLPRMVTKFDARTPLPAEIW